MQVGKAAAAAVLAAALATASPDAALAKDVQPYAGLTPCKTNAAFAKREKGELKTLTKRLKNVRAAFPCAGCVRCACTRTCTRGAAPRRAAPRRAARRISKRFRASGIRSEAAPRLRAPAPHLQRTSVMFRGPREFPPAARV